MIKYSTQNNHPANAAPLTEGLNLTAGNYSIFSDVAGTFDLLKNGTRVTGFPKTENAAPFDMNGSNGTNANLFAFTQGNWKLTFTPKTGLPQVFNFTVGTVTIPGDEQIVKEYIENGTHYVIETASGVYKVAVTKV